MKIASLLSNGFTSASAARGLILLLVLALPIIASADQVLQYGPAVVQVSGTMGEGKRKHPNGTWYDFSLIKLDAPASIKGDKDPDSFNVDEKNITEIQVSSEDDAILKKLGTLNKKKVTLTGTLFHAHTAWHARDLVLMVTSVK